ncbi:MAG: hypothetical protein E6J00_13465 [Chloroflexi bacterium]|nr:MAG: hypothetical protein E6J00_13465 [Chloroflexota bacterium]
MAHYDRVSFNTAAAMCRADLVAEATVVSVGLGHWNTANGTRPSNIDRRTVLTRGYSIVTPVSFTGVQTLLDHRSKRSNEFVTLGGVVGADRIRTLDYPSLHAAGRYLLVLVPTLDVTVGALTESRLTVIDAFPVDPRGLVHLQEQTIEQGQVSGTAITIPQSSLATMEGIPAAP